VRDYAQAIIHSPKVLILDEPASGLDPEARHGLARLFTRLRDSGMTLIVSSHILAELEEYSTSMLILSKGRLIEHSILREEHLKGRRLKLQLAAPCEAAPDVLLGFPGVSNVEPGASELSFGFAGDLTARHQLLKTLIDAGVPVCALSEERRNLQSSYLARVSADGDGR